jgi:hypothetical protein
LVFQDIVFPLEPFNADALPVNVIIAQMELDAMCQKLLFLLLVIVLEVFDAINMCHKLLFLLLVFVLEVFDLTLINHILVLEVFDAINMCHKLLSLLLVLVLLEVFDLDILPVDVDIEWVHGHVDQFLDQS